jgi:hypothetical protein
MTKASAKYAYGEIVVVRDTPSTNDDGIVGKIGTVRGIAMPDREGRPVTYTLGGHDFARETCVVTEDEVQTTGRFDPPRRSSTGDSIRVGIDGELLDP